MLIRLVFLLALPLHHAVQPVAAFQSYHPMLHGRSFLPTAERRPPWVSQTDPVLKLRGGAAATSRLSLAVNPQIMSQAVLTIAFGWIMARIKRTFIMGLMKKRTEHMGRLSFYNHFFNWMITAVVSVFLISLFDIDLGPGIKSIFAAGGVGALVFAIASKDLAEQVVGGLVIAAWDVFEEGEKIRLNEMGLEGTVKRIGLTDTKIELFDNLLIKIPNSQIFNQHVSNFSRVKRSQVKQTLRFRYLDLKKIPMILQQIKEEIKVQCAPEVIVDGSKPFRAHFSTYMEDHVQVVVNIHANVAPSTTAYLDFRQRVLEAIATAVEKCGVEFAIPSVSYQSEGSFSTSGFFETEP